MDPGRDILWKTPVPVRGYSSPIVHGDRVYLTGEGERVMAFDARTGKLLWNVALTPPPAPPLKEDEDPFEPGESGTASPTACTDGQRVIAFFGTGVLGCVDRSGAQVWAKRLVVRPRNSFGLAASPVLHKGMVPGDLNQ